MKHGFPTRDKDLESIDSEDVHSSDLLKRSSPHSFTRKRRIKNKDNKTLQENLIVNNHAIIMDHTASTTDNVGSHDSIEMMDVSHQSGITRDGPMSVSQRSIHGQTQTSHAFWNLCKCYVGAASFALPWAVSQTGVIPAIVGFILLSSLAYLTFRWMLIASHFACNNSNPTYPELAEIAFSSFFPIFGHRNDRMTHTNGDTFVPMEERETDAEQLISDASDGGDNMDQEFYDMMNANDQYNKYNYRCGMCGKIVVYLCMFFGMIGACGSYILFISGVIQNWLSAVIDPESTLSFYLSIAILLPFPIMLSLLRSYSFLSSTAKFGVAGVVLALLVTMYDGILHLSDGIVTKDVLHKNLVYFDLSHFPIFVGNACFLFVIHAMILSQEQSMIDRQRDSVSNQFKKANHLSLGLVTLINMVFAVFAYVSFIDMMPFPDNIVDGLDEGIIQQITRACLCIDLLFTYALIMYPFTEALDTELFDVTQLTNNTRVQMKGNAIRIAIVIITALIAIGIPHFGYLTGLTGGSASIFLGFILPPIFIWNDELRTNGKFVTNEKTNTKWLITGDLAKKDSDGYFYYYSRADDVIISAGYRIGPAEIENMCMKHESIANCAAIGVSDELRNQVVKLFVVLKNKINDENELNKLRIEIQTFAKKHIGKHEYPRVIQFVDDLPMTISKKIQRHKLREMNIDMGKQS